MAAWPARLAFAFAALSAPAAGAVELGTFFHTPEERAKLDRLRRGEPEQRTSVGAQERTTVPAVTGYVQRSDGKNTVWLDGRPVPADSPRAAPLFDPRKVQDEGTPAPRVLQPSKTPAE